jgi:type 1 fimbria pilin
MKFATVLLVCSLLVATIAPAFSADEKSKEVTIKGTVLCAMCALKETSKCQTAIQLKEGEKTVTYYFEDKGEK